MNRGGPAPPRPPEGGPPAAAGGAASQPSPAEEPPGAKRLRNASQNSGRDPPDRKRPDSQASGGEGSLSPAQQFAAYPPQQFPAGGPFGLSPLRPPTTPSDYAGGQDGYPASQAEQRSQRLAGSALLDLLGRLRTIVDGWRGDDSAGDARRAIAESRESGGAAGASEQSENQQSDRGDQGLFDFLLEYCGALDFCQSPGSRDALRSVVDRMDAVFAPTDPPDWSGSGMMAAELSGGWDPEADPDLAGAPYGWSEAEQGVQHAGGGPMASSMASSMRQQPASAGTPSSFVPGGSAGSTFPPYRQPMPPHPRHTHPHPQMGGHPYSGGSMRPGTHGVNPQNLSTAPENASFDSNSGLMFDSPAQAAAAGSGFFPRSVGNSSGGTGSSTRSGDAYGSQPRTGSGTGSGASDPQTLAASVSPTPPPLSATLSPSSIHALAMLLKSLPQTIPPVRASSYPPLVRSLNDLAVRLRSNGDAGFLEPLLKQVGWDDGIGAREFTSWWEGMVASLREQQRAQRAVRGPGRPGSPMSEASNTDGMQTSQAEEARGRQGRQEDREDKPKRGKSGGKGKEVAMPAVKQDPAEAALQESSFGLLALALSLMPGAKDGKEDSGKGERRGSEDWRGRIMEHVQGAPSRDDPVFREMLTQSGLARGGSIEGFIQHLAVFIVQKLPKAYRAVRKALMSLYLFLSELKTNNGGLDARKIDNMIQGQLCYHTMRLHHHPQGCFDAAFRSCLLWSRCNVTDIYFGISEQSDAGEGNYVDIDRLSTDMFGFISYDPVGVEGGQGSEPSEGGEDDGDDRVPLELSVPKIEYINTVAEALLLVEYLRRQWTRYRALFSEKLKWTNYCRLMGSSSSSENRFAKPLRKAAAIIHLSTEIQEVFRRPFAVDMKDLKEKLDKLEKTGTVIEAFSVERTLEAVERLKAWRIRTVSILELMSKLSDFCETLRMGGSKLGSERQLELLACFVSGLRTQIDPLQDSELYATFEDYVTRRFHFDASAATFDGGWNLNMFANALTYFVNILQNTSASSPDS